MLSKGSEGGYDVALTIFSPEGRLYQVEYALEAVRRGTLAVGLKSDKAAVIVIIKKVADLMDPESIHKIFKIDEHIGCAISGLHADSRILVDYARVQCQVNRLNYSEAVHLSTLVKRLADIKQQYTQYGGVRPFGSALLLISVDPDGTPQCMTTSPIGTFWSWQATAMGISEEQANKILSENIDKIKTASLEELMEIGIKTQQECAEDDLNPDNIQIAYIDQERKFKIAETDVIKKIFDKVKKA